MLVPNVDGNPNSGHVETKVLVLLFTVLHCELFAGDDALDTKCSVSDANMPQPHCSEQLERPAKGAHRWDGEWKT